MRGAVAEGIENVKPRRGTIPKAIALLAAGAALNVAVAWGTCIRASRLDHVMLSNTPIVPGVLVDYDPYWDSYGIPLKCLRQDNVALNNATLTGRRASWNGGIRLDGPRWLTGIRPIALPLLPIWPGFAINTVFYAGVLWVLFAIPFALRRMIRRRRGQCAHCAYPIGQNERCTECGAAVTPTSPATGTQHASNRA